jgi:hypothetical protein
MAKNLLLKFPRVKRLDPTQRVAALQRKMRYKWKREVKEEETLDTKQ